jgi:hypothetical protein
MRSLIAGDNGNGPLFPLINNIFPLTGHEEATWYAVL